jgi:GAF domain-containing protein
MKAAYPANESARIRALCELDILDSPPEAAFDDITRLAAELCVTPVALVSLVDGTRQWFKSRIGIEVTHTSRDVAFCAHALHSPDLLEVTDATLDPRFADNPLVTGGPGIRFYAGAPLLTPDGEVLGTLCVIDWTPRSLDDRQRRALRTLADQVMTQMRLRRQLHLQAHTEAALKALEERWQFALEASDEGVWDWNLLTDEVFFSDR